MATRNGKEWASFLVTLGVGTGLTFYLLAHTSRAAHFDFFGLGIVVYPFLALVWSKDSFGARLTRGVGAALYWLSFYAVYAEYMHRRWGGALESGMRHQPCCDWVHYTDETSHLCLEPASLCLVVAATVSLLLGLLVLYFRTAREESAA